MKISKIYSYKLNFGYDKKLNSELKSRLRAYPDKKWSKTISSLNSYCNKIEDNIKQEEKHKDKKNSKYADYVDIFSTYKQMLAGCISVTFDDFAYADREFKHYYDEFIRNGSNNNDWRKKACKSIAEWTDSSILQETEFDTKHHKAESEVKDAEQIDNNQENPFVTALGSSVSKLASKSFLEIFVPKDGTPKGFQDVAGMNNLKQDLKDGVIKYINSPEEAKLDFEEYGKTTPKAILLYGPPGCGKTFITQALASEIESPLMLLNISKAGSHYINLTSKNIKAAFDDAIKIAEKSEKPCLLFMDEVDSVGFDRNSRMEPDDLKQVATLLQALDTAKNSNLLVIGATNKYNLLDPAVRRRFDSKIFVDVPDKESIVDLLEKTLTPMKKASNLLSDKKLINEIASLLKGYSNSSICVIVKDAALNAMRRDRDYISVADFKSVLDKTKEEKINSRQYMSDSLKNDKRFGF